MMGGVQLSLSQGQPEKQLIFGDTICDFYNEEDGNDETEGLGVHCDCWGIRSPNEGEG
ncbi:hypothetical protein SAMN05518872_102196 [Psychrobacillus sp. OK032]|nr:hypothetical protein SAMN05518872_102196 [Psychrobacillus sp. OK032]